MPNGSSELLNALRAALAAHAPEDVVAAYLYGSRARGTAGDASDVDVAFFRRAASESTYAAQPYQFAARLEAELGHESDLVELNRAPVDLVHEVLRDGLVVLDRDPDRRVCMEVQARARYLDFLPTLRRYRRDSPSQTNGDLIEKKLAFIERVLRELREQAVPEKVEHDLREQRFVERELQLAVQAALDVASHVVSDARLEEPTTNAALFATLVRHGYLPDGLREPLVAMAKFRNVLVHGYVDVDPAIVRDVLEHHLGDLEGFVEAMRTRLAGEGY